MLARPDALRRFDSEAIAESVLRATGSATSDRFIYHYTDLAGLMGIIQARALWATHVRWVNDPGEAHFFRSFVTKRIEVAEDLFSSRYARLVEPDAYRALREKLIGSCVPNMDHERYIVSFSGDGDLMSQWRAYGANGRGFALGFNRMAFAGAKRESRFERIVYGNDAFVGAVDELMQSFFVYAFGDRVRDERGDEIIEGFVRNVGEAFHKISPWVKHSAYAEEREWRISVSFPPAINELVAGDLPKDLSALKEKLGPARTRKRGEQLVPYVPVNIDLPGVLDHIVCGPCVDRQLVEPGLKLLLLESGLLPSTTLRFSGLPYRG